MTAFWLVVTMVATGAVAVSAIAGVRSAAAAPPPGGIVDSVPGFGWTQGSFSVSDDGAARYTLPLWEPRGRGGDKISPKLALSFNSRAGNGPVGVGWSLGGLPSISWCPRTFSQDRVTDFAASFDGADPLCLDGNRLVPNSSPQLPQREYRTEQETFARITAVGTEDGVPDSFRVETKDGLVLTLGQTDNARLRAFRLQPGPDADEPNLVRAPGGRVTLAWAVDKIEDRNGNDATVEYLRAEGSEAEQSWVDMRPSVIRYEPNRRIEFAYESRPDPIDGFGGGVHTRLTNRIKTISMFAGPTGGPAELVREYQLSYLEDDYSITGRSLLSDIAECDGKHVCKTSLPLTWTPGSYDFEAIDETVGRDNLPQGFFAGDVNGDGVDDMIYVLDDPDGADPPTLVVRAGSRNGGRFGPPQESELPFNTVRVRPVDIDVDGKTDLIVQRHRLPNPPEEIFNDALEVHESDGLEYGPAVEVLDDGKRGLQEGFLLADLDGNGLPELLGTQQTQNNGPPDNWFYRLNIGAGQFGALVETNLPDVRMGATVSDTDGDGRAEIGSTQEPHTGWGLNAAGGVEGETLNSHAGNGDVNGDGLDDFVQNRWNPELEKNELRVRRDSGNGFDSPFTIPAPADWPAVQAGSEPFASDSMRIADFNNDGRSDVLAIAGEGCAGAASLFQWTGNEFARAQFDADVDACGSTGWSNLQPMDYNGDGLMDLVSVRRPAGNEDGQLRIFKRQGDMPDQLTGIGDAATGPRVEVGYTTLADRTVHTPCTDAVYPLVCVARGGTLVKEHRVATFVGAPGAISWQTYDHTYGQARQDLHGRGWLGFASHTVTEPVAGAKTVTEFDNVTGDPGPPGVYPRAHRPSKVTYTVQDSPTGREFRRTTTTDNQLRRLGGSYTVEPRHVVQTEEERPVSATAWQLLRRATNDTTFDDFGNEDLVTSTTTNGRKVTVDATFAPDTTNWLVNLPRRTVTTGCDVSNRCTDRTTTFDYFPDGNLEKTVVEPDQPALKLTTTTAYDQFGNPTSVARTDNTDVSRTETLDYSGNADKVFPTATIDALNHKTMIETDTGLGVQTKVTDPNGVVTTTRYDGFGRLRETNRSDGSFEHITHDLPNDSQQRTTTTDAGGGVTVVVVDQLGRERQRQVKAFDGRMATTRTDYDLRGRVRETSRPAFPDETAQYTAFGYDNRDRQVRQTAPDDIVVRNTYTGLETHTVDAKGTESYTVQNVDGDVASSFEDDPDSTAWLETAFEYDGFGQTTKITAPDRTVQTMHYDTLGRRDTSVDPSAGTAKTAYNAFGDTISETDGTGATTTYVPDALGRVKTATSPDGVATNTWDSAVNGIGKLASARSADGITVNYTYDDLSQVATANWTVDGTGYRFDYTYDLGRPATTTYPAIPGALNAGRLAVTNVYNASGYLNQVKDPAAGGTVYWQIPPGGRNAAGQLTTEALGNGVTTTRTYQLATGLLTHLTTTPAETTTEGLVDLGFTYDANRNLSGRTDLANHRAEVYLDDTLNRLKTWRLEAATTTYTYDTAGNLKTESVAGTPDRPDITYTYGENGARPHALTSRNTDHYGYDGAGRQTTGPQRTVAYNHLNLPKTIDWGQGQHTTFAYDPSGARALKRDAGQTVVDAGGLFERRTPAGTDSTDIHNLHNIVADGRVVAQVNRVQAAGGGPVTRTAVVYLHPDQQGSTVEVTNQAGQPVGGGDGFLGELFYDPFGARTNAGGVPLGHQRHGGPRQGYTGHEHDDEYGLINATGRIYDPEARRFLTPDPVTEPQSSQGLNRYAYVRNNPATLTDPTGYSPLPGLSAYDMWEFTAMGATAGWIAGVAKAIGGFFDLIFSLSATPGFDESSTAATMPRERAPEWGATCELESAPSCDLPDLTADSGTTARNDELSKAIKTVFPKVSVWKDPPVPGRPVEPTRRPGDPGEDLPAGALGPAAALAAAGGSLLALSLLGDGTTVVPAAYVDLYKTTVDMMEMRDWAVEQAHIDHSFKPMSPQEFGKAVDRYFKDAVQQGIDDGVLPAGLNIVPQGHFGPDVWLQIGRSDYVISWDVTTATVESIVQHDQTYIGTDKILYGATRRMEVLDVIPLVYRSIIR